MDQSTESPLMKLASIPITVEASETIDVAAQKMSQQHVGSLVVTAGGTPIGLITDRDVALAALRRPKGTELPTVDDTASKPLLTLDANATLDEATELFGRYSVRRLGLNSGDGKLIGVLSSDMVLVHLGDQLNAITVGIRREFQEEREPTSVTTTGYGPE